MGRDGDRGHLVTTHGDVPSHGMSYRRCELIPPLKLGPHPQSCAVSTHRPMESAECLQARRSSSGFRGCATPTKHHVARVRVARAFAELREPGARARAGTCKRTYGRKKERTRQNIFSRRPRTRFSTRGISTRISRIASFCNSYPSTPSIYRHPSCSFTPLLFTPYLSLSLSLYLSVSFSFSIPVRPQRVLYNRSTESLSYYITVT